jgi:hypothetical protein
VSRTRATPRRGKDITVELRVPKVDDFELTGAGSAEAWGRAEWIELQRLDENRAPYAARAKALWSSTGVYFLFDCEDRKLSCTFERDLENLYDEDVAEVFLQTDEAHPVYLEYEISPLGYELPLLVSNSGAEFHGWLGWRMEGERRTRRATAVRGGRKGPGASVEGWTAEFFLPFALFAGMCNVPPSPGARWRGNLYRIDYDHPPSTRWAWSPVSGKSFHEPARFGTLVFDG